MTLLSKKGVYQPKNIKKYVGKHAPIWRSSWELQFMRLCDNHDSVLYWSSESHRVPYVNPLSGKITHYVPDFLIVYVDAQGKQHAEMIEIKPSSQKMGGASGVYDKIQATINESKWSAAGQFCKANGLKFRVITEKDMFRNPQKPTPRRKTPKRRR